MAFYNELNLFLKARYPILYVNTIEEERIEYVIRKSIKTSLNRSIYAWDFIDGYTNNPNNEGFARRNPLQVDPLNNSGAPGNQHPSARRLRSDPLSNNPLTSTSHQMYENSLKSNKLKNSLADMNALVVNLQADKKNLNKVIREQQDRMAEMAKHIGDMSNKVNEQQEEVKRANNPRLRQQNEKDKMSLQDKNDELNKLKDDFKSMKKMQKL